MGGFAEACDLAVSNTYNTYGTVTRANYAVMTPDAVLALWRPGATAWMERNALLQHVLEMRACGVPRSPWADWLFSSNRPGMSKLINVKKAHKGPSKIEPFIMAAQKSMWNADHWNATQNLDKTAYDAQGGDLEPLDPLSATSGARGIRITSPWGTTLHADYFQPGKKIFVVARGASSEWTLTQFLISRSATNAAGTFIDVEAFMTQGTSAGTNTMPSFEEFTTGIVFPGTNNVNDVESWCYNMHNVNLEKLVPFWYRTRRHTRRIGSLYKEFLEKMMTENEYFKRFQDIPIAERNKQDAIRTRTEASNAYLFSLPISDNQTLALWGSLPQITSITGATVDPGTGSQLIAYRAEMYGIIPQLKECGQFVDNGNQPLVLNDFLENAIYDIYRARTANGQVANEIDIYTDSSTAQLFMRSYIVYSKNETGDIIRLNIEKGTAPIGFPFRRFELYKPSGVSVNILTDPVFDDAISAAAAGNESLMRWLMVLDLGGSIYPATLGSSRVQRTIGQIEDLAKVDVTFSCAISNPTTDVTMTSETETVIVECPLNSLAVTNFTSIVSGVV